ncbi:hypothetical protein GCM10009639_44540 [Kitasatospora putterlickiae]|uniref:Uncharacterized protein n=1 Tax=Kitasatospora putterlickiae TaxID=221725 RepID=A0ABN1YER3_9ACTN
MRAPARSRPARRSRRDRPPVGLAVAALTAAASTVGLATTSADPLPSVDLIVNGAFDSFPWIWTCDSNVLPSHIPHDHYVTGFPTAESNARCSQRVRVRPNSTYTLNATVRGPYAFVGVTGEAGENASAWSGRSSWNSLSLQVTTGPDTTRLTVHFHGWYEQPAYDMGRISFIGPGYQPSPCGEPDSPSPTATGGSATPSPSPTCQRTYIP